MSRNTHGTLNEVRLIGRLGTDPEMRYTASGTAVTTLSVCTQTSWTTSGGEERSEVEWHKVTIWGRQGEVCNQHLLKGARVEIAGSIHYTRWEDHESGQMRYGVEIRAQRVLFLDPRLQASAAEVEDRASDLDQMEPEPAASVIGQPKKRRQRKAVAA
jgi:single-strand DNA-binding protein